MKNWFAINKRALWSVTLSTILLVMVLSAAASVLHAQAGVMPVYQINCGGPAVGSFAADAYFEGGKTYSTNPRVDTVDVSNAAPTQVYNTQRYGNITYTFPNLNPGGAYVVRLHFAETYFTDPGPNRVQSKGVGKRVFIVLINHKVVLDRFDILAIANPNHAVVRQFSTTADDGGRIKVIFQSMIGSEAMINAIEILQGPGSSADVSPSAKPEASPKGLPSSNGKQSAAKVTFNAQNPCDNDDAAQKKGYWDRGVDDLAMADSTFPKDQYSLVLKKADQANAILKRAIADLSGIDIKAYRSIRGSPYVKNGPVPFGINAPVFAYGCIPLTAPDPNIRGTIVLGDETATWLRVYFNTVAGLVPAGASRLVNGARIYLMPKIEGQINGVPVLVPQRLDGWRDEVVIITLDGKLPFKPVSKEAYLLGRQKAVQAEIDRLSKLANISTSGMAEQQNKLESLTGLLNSMSDQEKQMQAIVKDPNAFPGNRWTKVFVTEAEGGYPLVTLSAKDFEPTSSRTAAKMISVSWTFGPQEPLQQRAVRQLKANLDVAALKQLLDQ